MPEAPKVFVSYSWTTPDHEEWVLELANELMRNGVHVILDKWDIREGNDVAVFMEQIVRNGDIVKVIMVCDRGYVEKANARTGGVGVEAQIITSEIYSSSSQSKFVAVVAERNDDGSPFLPIFYSKRKYIDLSAAERYDREFETLIRWIFDRPLYVRPELGSPPDFVGYESEGVRGTSGLSRRASVAIRSGKHDAIILVEEYFKKLVENISLLMPDKKYAEIDEEIHRLILNSVGIRSEYIGILADLARCVDDSKLFSITYKFLESLLNIKSVYGNGSAEAERDAIKFLAHELFLITIAQLIRHEKFAVVSRLLSATFYISPKFNANLSTVTFVEFREFLESIRQRNSRLGLRKLSLHAVLLQERATPSLPFIDIMQADFICFVKSSIENPDSYITWWPETLLYAARMHAPFEIFARAISASYLNNVMLVFGINNLSIIDSWLEVCRKSPDSIPKWEFSRINPSTLMNRERLGTRP